MGRAMFRKAKKSLLGAKDKHASKGIRSWLKIQVESEGYQPPRGGVILLQVLVGLLFFVPGFDETLRVNGKAQLRDEAHYTALFASDHFRPRLVIEVNVQEAYLHCAKALMRSRLWSAEAQVPRKVMPTLNQMIQSQLGMTGEPESQELMMARYGAVIAAEQGKQN